MFGKKWIAGVLAVCIVISGLYHPAKLVKGESGVKVIAESVESERGETVTMPVSIERNPGIMGFVINVEYDSKYLEPVGVEKGAILNGTFDDNSGQNEGFFEVLWSGTSDMNENGKLFDLKFRIKERAPGGSTAVKLSCNGADTFNESYQEVVLACDDCGVTVLGEELEEKESNVVHMDDYLAVSGKKLQVPVMLTNNTGIMGFVVNVKYNADVLKITSVDAGELLPNNSTFDHTAGVKDGEFRVLWAGNENAKDDGCLFSLNFEVIGAEGDTEIELTYNKKDTFNEKYQEIALSCGSCSIQIEEEGSTEENPSEENPSGENPTEENPSEENPSEEPTGEQKKCTIFMDSITVYTGENVRIPVKAYGNEGIMYCDITMRCDPKMLKIVSVDAGELLPDEYSNVSMEETEEEGVFYVYWNAYEEVKKDGCLFYLNCEVLGSEGNTQIVLESPYGWDGQYQNVMLNCRSCVVSIKDKQSEPQNPQNPIPPQPQNPNVQQPNIHGNGQEQNPENKLQKPARVKIRSLKKKGANRLQVKWKKIKNVSGYQIQYALNKKFTKGKKNKNVGKTKTSYVIKKLKSEKKYFVRIRAYRKSGGMKKYGRWSVPRNCKVLGEQE